MKRQNRQYVKRLAYLGVCTSIALVLAWVESMLPPIYAALPGIKLGLPNVAILFILYSYGVWDAAAVSFVRIVAIALMFGNPVTTIAYSLSGAILSLTGMAILKRVGIFSPVGVSVAGAVLHNVGQVLAAVILLETTMLWYYLVVLLITGVVSGIFVGLCGGFAVKRISREKL